MSPVLMPREATPEEISAFGSNNKGRYNGQREAHLRNLLVAAAEHIFQGKVVTLEFTETDNYTVRMWGVANMLRTVYGIFCRVQGREGRLKTVIIGGEESSKLVAGERDIT